ncbi:hypothetical protein Tco_0417465 [Tanacetum coccineum]
MVYVTCSNGCSVEPGFLVSLVLFLEFEEVEVQLLLAYPYPLSLFRIMSSSDMTLIEEHLPLQQQALNSIVDGAYDSYTAGDIFEDEMMTIADTLVAIRSTRPRTNSVVIRDVEEEPRRATLAKDAALIAEFDNVQVRIEANALLAARLQEEEREQFSIDEQARFLVETIAERKKFFAAQRAKQIRNKPPTKTQLRNKMITYLKNMGRYTHSQLKNKSLEEIQKLYEREQKWINDFVPMDSEEGGKKAESSKKEAASSKKRQKADPDDENVKRQKLEDAAEKEGLKAYLKIIIGSDLQGNDLSYWKITRADGSSKFYKVFSMMLEDFDRQDLVDLHRLVKERSASRALEGYDLILWGDLKTMFEPSEEDDVWRNQQDWSLISWKLYETCGVHTLLMDGTLVCINMLVEQKYPLTQEMLTRMLNWRLEADFENEMAYELIRGGLLGIKASQVSTAGYKSFYCWLKKLLLVKIRENSLSKIRRNHLTSSEVSLITTYSYSSSKATISSSKSKECNCQKALTKKSRPFPPATITQENLKDR